VGTERTLGTPVSQPSRSLEGWFLYEDTDVMTIQELVDEMNRFVAAMGWYEEDSPWRQTPRNIAISLSLESSEVLEHFQWGERADSDTLAGELADVALYLLQLAYLTGIDLEQAILDKLAINYNRDWSQE
jgi:NTP pyrophosphatase (non-canonical NTP hydrolase)